MEITLNFPQQRIEGGLQVSGELATGLHANGSAELVMSGKPGGRYWYFFAGADFQLQTPSLSGQAGLLIGDHLLDGDLLAKFDQYSNKGVPPAFRDIDGFFLDGMVALLIQDWIGVVAHVVVLIFMVPGFLAGRQLEELEQAMAAQASSSV